MKIPFVCASLTLLFSAGALADDQTPVPLDPLIEKAGPGTISARDFAAHYKDLQVPRISVYPPIAGYEEISHSSGRPATWLGIPIDQATIDFRSGQASIIIYFVDRGHAVSLTHDQYDALLKQCMDAISARLKSTPGADGQDRPTGAYAGKVCWPGASLALESSYTNEDPARNIPFKADSILVQIDLTKPLPALSSAPTPATPAKTADLDPNWKIPKSFSLRDEYQKMELVPKNQGRRGSCTVFATVGVIEFHMGMHGDNARLSEQFAAWAADQVLKDTSKRDRYTPDDLIQGIQAYGICTEALMPYRTGGVGHPSKAALEDAATRKHIGVTTFKKWAYDQKDGFSTDEIRAICGSIAEGSPVSVGCGWPGAAELDASSFLVDHHNIPSTKEGTGHVIVLVGYEINASIEGGGAFVFRQSWGDNWGDGGYAKLSFEYMRKHGAEAYAVKLY